MARVVCAKDPELQTARPRNPFPTMRALLDGSMGVLSANAHHDMVLSSLLMRVESLPWSEVVRIYIPGPTLALSARDMRAGGVGEAIRLAERAGFKAVVRPAGGRMVAYDSGSVVIDHVARGGDLVKQMRATFAENARSHAAFLRHTWSVDARVGSVLGEYCPGEFSVNVAGIGKIVGSGQRIVGHASLFSSLVQVSISPQVRTLLMDASVALGYSLRESSITGLADHASCTPSMVAASFREDYARRLGLSAAVTPAEVADVVQSVPVTVGGQAFPVDKWVREALKSPVFAAVRTGVTAGSNQPGTQQPKPTPQTQAWRGARGENDDPA